VAFITLLPNESEGLIIYIDRLKELFYKMAPPERAIPQVRSILANKLQIYTGTIWKNVRY
jgi:hypothetical protein